MVRNAFFWSAVSQAATFVIQFGTAIIVARLLTPHQVGVYAVALAITGIIQVFGSFSVGTYVLREGELSEEIVRSAFTINAIISTALAVVIFAASFVGERLFNDADVPRVLQLLALLPILSIFIFRPGTMLQRAMQGRGMAIAGTLALLVTSAVTIGCAVAGLGSMSPAYGSVVGAIVGSVGTVIAGRGHNSMQVSLRHWRPITTFGLRLMSIGGVAAATQRVCDMLVGHFLGLTALGLYFRASTLNSTIFTNFYSTGARVIFAKLSDAQRVDDNIGPVFVRSYRLITSVMGPLLVGIAVLAGPLVQTLYGKNWIAAAPLLSLLALGQLLGMCFAMNWELFVLRDELKTQTRLEIIRSASLVVVRSIGAAIGLIAVAASAIVESVIAIALYQSHMPRLARMSPSVFHRAYLEMAGLGAVAALPSFVLMLTYRWSPATPLLEIAIAVAIGAIFWMGMLIRLRHPTCHEIALLLAKLGIGVPRILRNATTTSQARVES